MPPVSEWTRHISESCARHMLSLHELGPRLGIDPKELLDIINAKRPPTPAVIRGLARELDISQEYLQRLAAKLPKP